MSETSYEFDPCSIDESHKEEKITLDNWKPRPKADEIIKSEWRQKQIGTNFNQEPGLDELKKIQVYLKKKKKDSDIMSTFGISAETLVAIKKNKYCPIDGISMDSLSKIYAEFKVLGDAILKLKRSSEYVAKTLFTKKADLKKYKDFCNASRGAKQKNTNIEEADISIDTSQERLPVDDSNEKK